MSGSLAELVGAVIGDGNLWRDSRHYRIDINGHPKLDRDYYDYLRKITRTLFDREPYVRTRKRTGSIQFRICSKEAFRLLTEKLGLPYGRGKGQKVTIPEKFYSSWSVLMRCVRGIADTDGCFSLTQRVSGRFYPSIQISTTSANLAIQLKEILIKRGFRVYFRKQTRKKEGWNTRYCVVLSGAEMAEKWMKEIGFSNPRHIRKYDMWKKKLLKPNTKI
ncbi:MAG: LAGLIDADG family homing endonuclease [Candidatus Hadarchaeaceae archaeon]